MSNIQREIDELLGKLKVGVEERLKGGTRRDGRDQANTWGV